MTFKDAQKTVKDFAKERGWKDEPSIDKFDHLHEELIEMSQHFRYKSKKEIKDFLKKNPDIFLDGIGDLQFALCRLANQLGVDIEDAFALVTKRIQKKYKGKGKEVNKVK